MGLSGWCNARYSMEYPLSSGRRAAAGSGSGGPLPGRDGTAWLRIKGMSKTQHERNGVAVSPGCAADLAAGQRRTLAGRALGFLHHLRGSCLLDDFVLAAVVDAIVELEAVDTVPVESIRAEVTGLSSGELLDRVADLVGAAGGIAPADAAVFVCEARRLQRSP